MNALLILFSLPSSPTPTKSEMRDLNRELEYPICIYPGFLMRDQQRNSLWDNEDEEGRMMGYAKNRRIGTKKEIVQQGMFFIYGEHKVVVVLYNKRERE